MKTRKLMLFASVLAIAVLGLSVSPEVNATEWQTKNVTDKSAHMSFDQAVQNSGILQAMYEQLDDSMLPHNWPYFTARIKYQGNDIFIQGSYQQWFLFFRNQLIWLKYQRQ